MARNPFQCAALELYRECFEGRPEGQNYTWFVERKEGIFDALASADAGRASAKPSDGCATIAAHAYHVLYALRLSNSEYGRPKPEGTWEDSWSKQTVTEEEWTELIGAIHDEYLFLLIWFENVDEWENEESVMEALSPLPHMAFHLGAMRQILKIV